MSNVLQDLRYAVRVMGKNPGFTLVAVLTLALGIGANATIFTWVNGFLLNGFPGVPDQDRMVIFSSVFRGNSMSVSYPDFVDFRDRNTLLEGIVATDLEAMSLVLNGQAERIYGKLVSGDYFNALGVHPAIGRGFLPEEGRTLGKHPVVVISHALWHRKFGGDRSVIGKEITLNNASFTVVGVTPPEFRGTYIGLSFDAYVPLMMYERFTSGSNRKPDGSYGSRAGDRASAGSQSASLQYHHARASYQCGKLHAETRRIVSGRTWRFSARVGVDRDLWRDVFQC